MDSNPNPNPNPEAIWIRPLNPAVDLPTEKVPLACPVLSRFLGGGIPIGSITELSGESGSGKTQLSLHLLLSSPSPSLFVHTEYPFPLRRLQSMAAARNDRNALDRIFVRGAHSPDDLLESLAAVPSRFRLLVIDSVAALFRSEFDNSAGDLYRRSALFFRLAARLKQLARDSPLAVVVTNHVVDVMAAEEGGSPSGVRVGNWRELWSSGRRVGPALGISWANCVNTRLFLSRTEERVEEGTTRTRRAMQVVFAPHLPPCSAEFVILKGGVFGVTQSHAGNLFDEMLTR